VSPKQGVHEKQISLLHATSFISFSLFSLLFKKAKKRIRKKERRKKNPTHPDSLVKQKEKNGEIQDIHILLLRSCF